MSIFVCYAHGDMEFKKELLREMAPLKHREISIWHDELIGHGEEWRQRIEKELNEAEAAILLVSTDFLASEFCQLIELPQIKKRHEDRNLHIYPILVRNCGWEEENWLGRFEMRPKIEAKLKPLSRLDEHEKEDFYVELYRELLYNFGKKGKNEHERQKLLKEDSIDIENIAVELADEYNIGSMEALKPLVERYIKLHKLRTTRKLAKELFCKFKTNVSDARMDKAKSNLDAEIISLLEKGLPENPIHFKDIYNVSLEAIFTPNYANLIHAIRLTEVDGYAEALSFLKKCNTLSDCALSAYIQGQCYRKNNNLLDAQAQLDLAYKWIMNPDTRHCATEENRCPVDILKVEILRGIGAVHRKLNKLEEAKKYFEQAIELCEHCESISPKVKSDVFYSFGYLYYEWAYKAFHSINKIEIRRIDKQDFNNDLKNAENLFKNSFRLSNYTWDAPCCRLYIVKLLLGEKSIQGFLQARLLGINENSVESLLTAAISGFAVLSIKKMVHKTPDIDFDAKSVYKNLSKLFQTWLVPTGARQCHSFDIDVIFKALFKDENATGDRYLDQIHALLNDSKKWKVESMEDQKRYLRNFKYGNSTIS